MSTKSNWTQELADWAASGLSKKKFCESRGLRYQSFIYHFGRSQPNRKTHSFEQISLPDVQFSDRVDFYFSDGRCVCFPVSTPKEVVRFLVSL